MTRGNCEQKGLLYNRDQCIRKATECSGRQSPEDLLCVSCMNSCRQVYHHKGAYSEYFSLWTSTRASQGR